MTGGRVGEAQEMGEMSRVREDVEVESEDGCVRVILVRIGFTVLLARDTRFLVKRPASQLIPAENEIQVLFNRSAKSLLGPGPLDLLDPGYLG